MNADRIMDYLRSAAREVPGTEARLSRDAGIASVRIWHSQAPEVWAEIASPGVMWARVSVNGGFMLVEADDTMDDAELLVKIDECFAVAAAYLENRQLPRGRFFPVITIETHLGARELKRSLASDLLRLLSSAGRRK